MPGGIFGLLRMGILGFGALMAVIMAGAGVVQYPKAASELSEFRKDPGCAAGFAATVAGRCRVVDAVALTVTPAINSSKSAGQSRANVRFPDQHNEIVYLDGPSADDFAHAVYPGDPVKVQMFGGQAVAIEGRDIVAGTTLSPSVREASARTMPIVGAVMLVVIGVVWWVFGRRRFIR
ncbi:hypothetical protein [Asticcacaulis solisilvae]|uniref:hypothetical protein n=1 Tax=Asticcacaulis solisilvae TaxID=1217274 RepID=UPI003FD7F9F8